MSAQNEILTLYSVILLDEKDVRAQFETLGAKLREIVKRKADCLAAARLLNVELPGIISNDPLPDNVRGIVLAFLQNTGRSHRAPEIQEHVETVLCKRLHPKTVGMTLYRLSRAVPPKVLRKGRLWHST